MTKDYGRDGEETRELPRVSDEERFGADSDDAGKKAGARAGWLESGAEDPAFFIKPSDAG